MGAISQLRHTQPGGLGGRHPRALAARPFPCRSESERWASGAARAEAQAQAALCRRARATSVNTGWGSGARVVRARAHQLPWCPGVTPGLWSWELVSSVASRTIVPRKGGARGGGMSPPLRRNTHPRPRSVPPQHGGISPSRKHSPLGSKASSLESTVLDMEGRNTVSGWLGVV